MAVARTQPRGQREAHLRSLVSSALYPPDSDRASQKLTGSATLESAQWRVKSSRLFHLYRWIERTFGGDPSARSKRLTQTYEMPGTIATGSGAQMLASTRNLPGGDERVTRAIADSVLRRFAWADGLATYVSDAYRGGMVANFLLAAFAVIGGVAYLPLAPHNGKWPFALFEFVLLLAILVVTVIGRRRRWHGRWFEIRRVAEYLRHAPILLLLGVARSRGRWPRGADTVWPEYYARHTLREIGLPHVEVTTAYLRAAVETLLSVHVTTQRDYHRDKARRLTATHHGLDHLSEILFRLALVTVGLYLVLVAASAFGLVPEDWAEASAKTFTFLGVAFPTLGGAFAGIRYFGDFERFAAISDVTAEKLDGVEDRIKLLLASPDRELHFRRVADLAHAVDDIVVTEIENWQAVFGGKQITVPG
jgi:hypothetical protein